MPAQTLNPAKLSLAQPIVGADEVQICLRSGVHVATLTKRKTYVSSYALRSLSSRKSLAVQDDFP
jgi:hypothetical protein